MKALWSGEVIEPTLPFLDERLPPEIGVNRQASPPLLQKLLALCKHGIKADLHAAHQGPIKKDRSCLSFS